MSSRPLLLCVYILWKQQTFIPLRIHPHQRPSQKPASGAPSPSSRREVTTLEEPACPGDFQHNDPSAASRALGSSAPKGSDPRDAVPCLRTGCLRGWPTWPAAQRGFRLARSTWQGPALSQAMPERASELDGAQGYHSNDKSMSAFPLHGITLGRPLIFIFHVIQNDRRTKNCFTNSI